MPLKEHFWAKLDESYVVYGKWESPVEKVLS